MDVGAKLRALAEPGYREFTIKLTPGAEDVLGVRMGHLRSIAKELLREGWRDFLGESGKGYELDILRALVIAGAKCPLEEKLQMAAGFIPTMANWAVCDTFCSAFRDAARHPDKVWAFLLPYLDSERAFEVRFAVVMLLAHYVDEEHIPQVLELLGKVRHEGYYVKMGVAWAVSACYAKFPQLTEKWLESCLLDKTTYNKSIQKICESYRVDADAKERLRQTRR